MRRRSARPSPSLPAPGVRARVPLAYAWLADGQPIRAQAGRAWLLGIDQVGSSITIQW